LIVEKERMEFLNILVPVAGTKADEGALELACNLAKKKKGKIFAVHVIPIERSLPLDAEIRPEIGRAEDILAQAENIAQDMGCMVETDILQAREVGPAIIDEAKERDIDMILVGVTYKKHYGQFCLGDVLPYVLKNAPCRVILDHQIDT
jgi:nucleotide-binding universal stress UspA family protein